MGVRAGMETGAYKTYVRIFNPSERQKEPLKRIFLIEVENLLHIGPPLPFGTRIERTLARLANSPPTLGLGVGSHLGHVGSVVGAYIFVVAKEQPIFVVDAVVFDVALLDHAQHSGPSGSVQTLVLL